MWFNHSPPLLFSPRHILVVEDNPDGREALHLLLTLLGHHVDVASDGVEGVRLALELRPEIAIVDIGLPGLNGYEVARRVRAGLKGLIVLIAYTAYDQVDVRDKVAEAGFDGYLVKPLGIGELVPWLSQAANRLP